MAIAQTKFAAVRSHTPQAGGFICFSPSPRLGFSQRGWKWGKKNASIQKSWVVFPNVTPCQSKAESWQVGMWQHRVLFLKFFSQFLNWPWHPNEKCSKVLEVSKLALLCKQLNCVFPILITSLFLFSYKVCQLPSAHLRHQKTLEIQRNWVCNRGWSSWWWIWEWAWIKPQN